MLYLLLSIILTAFLLTVGFFTCMTIQNALEQGVWVPRWVMLIGKGLYPIAALADIAFNFFIAPFFVIHDLPHGVTFSNTVQWYVDHPEKRWHAGALKYANFLNFVRKDHIKRVT
jgi:hypothetical protein